MFIKEDSTVDVIIYYKKVGMHFECYSEEDFKSLEGLSEEDRDKFKKITIKMRELTWGLYNELQEGASDRDDEGNRLFNYKKYKEIRLNKLVASWDATATDNDGKEVPVKVTEKSIKCLAPEIAETILNAYDSVVYLSEEEETK